MEDFQISGLSGGVSGGGIAIGFGAIGAAIGEGYTAGRPLAAISRNPQISGDIFKTMLVGQAMAESASIFRAGRRHDLAVLEYFHARAYVTVAALLAAGLSMGFGAIGAGVGSGMPGGAACIGMARQPAMQGRLTTNMLIGSAVCQTPAIFALVVSFMLLFWIFRPEPVNPTWAAVHGRGPGRRAFGDRLGHRGRRRRPGKL